MPATRDLLKQLMSFKPVSSREENVNQAVNFLNEWLQDRGVHTTIEMHGARKILFAAKKETKTPRLLFNIHLDVVPAPDHMFELNEKDGFFTGRGTHDCLGNCALIAQILASCAANADVGAVFSTDEEQGGQTTATMVERGYAGTDAIIVVDGSGYAVIVAQKGVLSLTLTATGAGCHAAEPWKGDNAIDKLIDGYQSIRHLFPDVEAGDEWHNTAAATTIKGGEVHNRVPETASMSLNIRFTEQTNPDDIVEQIKQLSQLAVSCDMRCDPVFCNHEEPVIKSLTEHMQNHLEHEITITRSNGATDARHFAKLGVPVSIIGIPGKGLHADDEAAEIKGLDLYESMLLSFVNQEATP